jgi:hypothetical protein
MGADRQPWWRLSVIAFVGVIGVIALLTVGAAGSAAQSADDPPESSGEFLDAFLELQGATAFEEYTEFETVRSVGVASTQVGEFSAADRQRMDAVYRMLAAFDLAYREAQAGNYSRSLEAANRSAQALDDLQAANAKYAPLAQLALDRFLRDQAGQLLEQAEDTEQTADRVRLLSQSARAYKLAGATGRFTEVSSREQRNRAELQEDVEIINGTIDDATAFLDSCTECSTASEAISGLGPDVFGSYRTAFALDGRLESSERRTSEHGLDEQREQIQSMQGEIGAIQRALALASSTLMIGFLLVVAVFTAALSLRVTVWHQDASRAGIGKSVLAEEVADA